MPAAGVVMIVAVVLREAGANVVLRQMTLAL